MFPKKTRFWIHLLPPQIRHRQEEFDPPVVETVPNLLPDTLRDVSRTVLKHFYRCRVPHLRKAETGGNNPEQGLAVLREATAIG